MADLIRSIDKYASNPEENAWKQKAVPELQSALAQAEEMIRFAEGPLAKHCD